MKYKSQVVLIGLTVFLSVIAALPHEPKPEELKPEASPLANLLFGRKPAVAAALNAEKPTSDPQVLSAVVEAEKVPTLNAEKPTSDPQAVAVADPEKVPIPNPHVLTTVDALEEKQPLQISSAPSPPAAAPTTALASFSSDPKLDFYIITTIFNPAKYAKRYELYYNFAKYIEASGVPLITIEAIFPSLDQKEFQVTQSSNPFHIQLTSDSIYWAKENLINIAASRLPPNAKYIAWIDADIEFVDTDWVEKTLASLEKYSVVQLFEYGHFLNADREILRTDYSFGYSVVKGRPIHSKAWYPHPGYAWAMSRSTFDQVKGLPEYCIVGMADLYFAYSLVNEVQSIIEKDYSVDYKLGILKESQGLYDKLKAISEAESKAVVGYVPLTLNHMWHGSRDQRQYVERISIIVGNDFNFYVDMRKDDVGLLQFVANGTREAIQNDIGCYFEARNEDSIDGISSAIANEGKCAHYKLLVESRQPEDSKDALGQCSALGPSAGHNYYGNHYYGGHYYGGGGGGYGYGLMNQFSGPTYNTYYIYSK